MHRGFTSLATLALLCIAAAPLEATQWVAGPHAGLMQQPTSQYYHFVYGGYVGVQTEAQRIGLRYQYFERPRFSAAGFEEQEFGHFVFIGGKITDPKKPYGLHAYLGGGKVSGYIKKEEQTNPDIHYPKRRYAINGATLAIDAAIRVSKFEFAIGHQHFTGISSREEFDSHVGWPFNFYSVKIGLAL
jgi:hypothetical protein